MQNRDFREGKVEHNMSAGVSALHHGIWWDSESAMFFPEWLTSPSTHEHDSDYWCSQKVFLCDSKNHKLLWLKWWLTHFLSSTSFKLISVKYQLSHYQCWRKQNHVIPSCHLEQSESKIQLYNNTASARVSDRVFKQRRWVQICLVVIIVVMESKD